MDCGDPGSAGSWKGSENVFPKILAAGMPPSGKHMLLGFPRQWPASWREVSITRWSVVRPASDRVWAGWQGGPGPWPELGHNYVQKPSTPSRSRQGPGSL